MKLLAVALFALLAACQQASPDGTAAMPGGASTAPWSGVAPGDTLHFTGTEPFWGGKAAHGTLTWQAPDDPRGTEIPVERFSGRNGIGLSGTLAGDPFEMAVSEGDCSDGMSDRRYPFTVTVRRGSQTLRGCGWSDVHPFTGPAKP